MSGAPPDERLEAARRLDAEAIRAGEEGAEGRALRAKAAALRVEAIGARVYPVAVCSACFRITGWTGRDGRCDACLRHAALARASAGGWGRGAPVLFPAPAPAPSLALATRLGGRLGARGALERAVARRWREHVDPGETGPVGPEPGFEVEVAVRDEIERVEGAGLLVRFASSTHRFDGGGWARLPSTRVARSQLPNPAEFAADLPIEVLVEAWSDYRQALAAINRRAWSGEEAARERERLARAERDAVLREQVHTAELLEE